MTTTQGGQFVVGATAQNGAAVAGWLASRFGSLPVAQDTPLPSGSPDAGPVTTSPSYGAPGAWELEFSTDDDFWISITWAGHVYYMPWTTPGGSGGSLPSWMQVGTTTPVGTVTPYATGAAYWDMSDGALYLALGATSADWICVGGNGDQTVAGVTSLGGAITMLAASGQSATISDVDAIAGSGNYFRWVSNGTDGDQIVEFQVGAAGFPVTGSIDATGKLTLPGLLAFDGVNWFVYSGDPNSHVTALAKGDLCVDISTPAVYQAGAASNSAWAVLGGGGASTPLEGLTQYSEAQANEVDLLAYDPFGPGPTSTDIPAADFTYSEPTLTAVADGVLTLDGVSPTVGKRILIASSSTSPAYWAGVYVVTAAGSVSAPWVLTRSADYATGASLGADLLFLIKSGTAYAGAVVAWRPGAYGSSYVFGANTPLAVNLALRSDNAAGPTDADGANAFASGLGARASGYGSIALDDGSDAAGYAVYATGQGAHAEGDSAVADGHAAHAEGSTTQANADYAHAEGNNSLAVRPVSHAGGGYSLAYRSGQYAHTSNDVHTAGDAQYSRIEACNQTTDATPTPLETWDYDDLIMTFLKADGVTADWTRTMIVRVRLVARRIDTPGTDSAWTFGPAVLRGDGTSAYSWVGGSAPTKTLIAQDGGASTWTGVIAISSNGLSLTVTGEVAETINWEATLELDEVAG